MQRKNHQRNGKGQTLVEFAFAIPFLLLCLFGIVYFGKAFFTIQVLAYSAQEGARAASRVPHLLDANVRENARGFTVGGSGANPNSIIYSSLGAAHLLSNGTTGDLPPGASVKILPWDSDGSADDAVQPGTVAVRIEYPFSLLINPFTGASEGDVSQVAIPLSPDGSPPVKLPDFTMSEKAAVAQEVYQEVN